MPLHTELALTVDEKTTVLQNDSDQACFPSDLTEFMSGAFGGLDADKHMCTMLTGAALTIDAIFANSWGNKEGIVHLRAWTCTHCPAD